MVPTEYLPEGTGKGEKGQSELVCDVAKMVELNRKITILNESRQAMDG